MNFKDISKTTLLVCATIIICVMVGVYGWLAIRHVDTTQFLYVAGTIIAPNLGIIFTLLKAEKASNKAEAAVQNTNGVMNRLVDDIPRQVQEAVQEAVSNGENEVKH